MEDKDHREAEGRRMNECEGSYSLKKLVNEDVWREEKELRLWRKAATKK